MTGLRRLVSDGRAPHTRLMNERVPSEVPATEASPVAATEAETRAFLLERSGRNFAPINKLFVQTAPGTSPRHGPLSTFVRRRDLRALRTELLLLGMISSGDGQDGWSATLPIAVWARAFGTTRDATGSSAATAVSKTLARLEERKLIVRARSGRQRKIRVTLLREDGSAKPYTRPGKGNSDRFLRLPHAYWLDGWYGKLDLPATAMLLVALHEKPGFRLPTERVPEWYGWSADTAERGLATLIELGLLEKTSRLTKAPLSPSGLAKINEYRLLGPFEQPGPSIHRVVRKPTAKKKPSGAVVLRPGAS
jgi:hypothetical protein